jgi:hypothetical protein
MPFPSVTSKEQDFMPPDWTSVSGFALGSEKNVKAGPENAGLGGDVFVAPTWLSAQRLKSHAESIRTVLDLIQSGDNRSLATFPTELNKHVDLYIPELTTFAVVGEKASPTVVADALNANTADSVAAKAEELNKTLKAKATIVQSKIANTSNSQRLHELHTAKETLVATRGKLSRVLPSLRELVAAEKNSGSYAYAEHYVARTYMQPRSRIRKHLATILLITGGVAVAGFGLLVLAEIGQENEQADQQRRFDLINAQLARQQFPMQPYPMQPQSPMQAQFLMQTQQVQAFQAQQAQALALAQAQLRQQQQQSVQNQIQAQAAALQAIQAQAQQKQQPMLVLLPPIKSN